MLSAKSAVCLCSPCCICHCGRHYDCIFIFNLHTSDVHQHTFNRSRVATLSQTSGL